MKIYWMMCPMLALLACQFSQAPLPHVPENVLIEIPRVQDFELVQGHRVLLNSSKFFLWPEHYTGENVRLARKISRDVDELDEASFSVRLDQKKALEDLEQAGAQAGEWEAALVQLRADLARLEKEITDEEALPGGGSQARLGELRRARQATNMSIAATETKKVEGEQNIARLSAALEALEVRAQEIEQKGTEAVVRLTQNVDWKGSAASVWFEAKAEGGIAAGISRWDFEDGERPRSFGTERGNIRNVLYKPHGSVFEFDVDVQAGQYWHFVVERIGYRNLKRSFYQGEITVIDRATGATLRSGVVKLVDKKTP